MHYGDSVDNYKSCFDNFKNHEFNSIEKIQYVFW